MVWRRLRYLIEILRPYVRIVRVLVTFIAPIILMVLYVLHQSYRTKSLQKFIRNFKSDRIFLSPTMSLGSMFRAGNLEATGSIMDLTQLNDMFWVRLTQVIATVIGY